MWSIESRLVTEQSYILFAGVYVCTFSPEILQSVAVKGLNTFHINRHAYTQTTSLKSGLLAFWAKSQSTGSQIVSSLSSVVCSLTVSLLPDVGVCTIKQL